MTNEQIDRGMVEVEGIIKRGNMHNCKISCGQLLGVLLAMKEPEIEIVKDDSDRFDCGKPDPIVAVYEKWKESWFSYGNWQEDCLNDMWNAIRSYCENKGV